MSVTSLDHSHDALLVFFYHRYPMTYNNDITSNEEAIVTLLNADAPHHFAILMIRSLQIAR